MIVADENEQMAEVDFTNTYDGTLTSGYGVVNHFEYDETGESRWTWVNPTEDKQ